MHRTKRSTKTCRIPIALAVAMVTAAASTALAADDLADVRRAVAERHGEAVKRLQDWIALPLDRRRRPELRRGS